SIGGGIRRALQGLGIEQILQLRCVRCAIGETDQRLEQVRRVGIGELIGVDRHKPRQQVVGGKASAGESNVGEKLAQRLVRARLVVVVRIGEVGGRIERHESSYLRGVSKAEEESNLLRKTQDTVVDKKLRRAAWHESEGRIEGKRLEQRTLVEVGAL